jgi:hypothetical protein
MQLKPRRSIVIVSQSAQDCVSGTPHRHRGEMPTVVGTSTAN